MLRETHGHTRARTRTHTDMLTNVTIRKQEGYSPCNKCAQHKWDHFFKKLRNERIIRSKKRTRDETHFIKPTGEEEKKDFFHII